MAPLPPQRRSPVGSRWATHVGVGELVLPRCRDCGTVQYPPRERCRRCLGDHLEWAPVPAQGALLSWTLVRASVEPFFRAAGPWPMGRVKLACGPVVIVHLDVATPAEGMAVQVGLRRDAGGAAVLIAMEPGREQPAPALSGLLGPG